MSSTSPWMCRFFGLKEEDKEVYWEQIFALIYYGGLSLHDAWSMPIPMRMWFIKRLQKELSGGGDGGESARDARLTDPSLSPEMRAMMGSMHPTAPHKLKRL
jgi:hypothetical protein